MQNSEMATQAYPLENGWARFSVCRLWFLKPLFFGSLLSERTENFRLAE